MKGDRLRERTYLREKEKGKKCSNERKEKTFTLIHRQQNINAQDFASSTNLVEATQFYREKGGSEWRTSIHPLCISAKLNPQKKNTYFLQHRKNIEQNHAAQRTKLEF